MSEQLTEGEKSTLTDVADIANCLIHDGPTIEILLSKGLIRWEDASNCLRITDRGTAALVRDVTTR